MDLVRRISALALVVTLSALAVPVPIQAAVRESPSPSLTLTGRPLSQVLNRSAVGDPLPLAGFSAQADGQISGVLLDTDGQPFAAQRVELDLLGSEELRPVATTDANGVFSYTGLGLGRYEDLHQVDRKIRARSGRVDLAAGAMQVSGISVNASTPSEGGGAGWIAIGAVSGGAAAVLLYILSFSLR